MYLIKGAYILYMLLLFFYIIIFIASPKTLNNFHLSYFYFLIFGRRFISLLLIFTSVRLALRFPKLYVNPTRNEVLSLSMLFLNI